MDLPELTPAQKRLVEELCRRHFVRRLALFGSFARGEGREGSDVDLLVSFLEDREPGLLGLMALQEDLGEAFGRTVDLNTPEDLSRFFRDRVVREAVDLLGLVLR